MWCGEYPTLSFRCTVVVLAAEQNQPPCMGMLCACCHGCCRLSAWAMVMASAGCHSTSSDVQEQQQQQQTQHYQSRLCVCVGSMALCCHCSACVCSLGMGMAGQAAAAAHSRWQAALCTGRLSCSQHSGTGMPCLRRSVGRMYRAGAELTRLEGGRGDYLGWSVLVEGFAFK
jgi:hypothetical protein